MTLAIVRGLLHVLPFPQIRKRYLSATELVADGELAGANGPRDDGIDVKQLAWAIDVISRRLPRVLACLPRAITLCKMLERRGLSATLRIGVGRESDGAFVAHAWVVYRGVVVLGDLPNLDRYVPLSNWPQRAK